MIWVRLSAAAKTTEPRQTIVKLQRDIFLSNRFTERLNCFLAHDVSDTCGTTEKGLALAIVQHQMSGHGEGEVKLSL